MGLAASAVLATPLDPALSRLLLTPGQLWTRSASLALVKQVMADGQCTAQEFALLQQLATAGEAPLSIEGMTVAQPSGEGLEIFRLVTEQQDLMARWKGGAPQMQGLIDLTEISPQYGAQAQSLVAQHLLQIYRRPECSVANQYEPLRVEIQRAFTLMNSLPTDSGRRGLALLYRACQMADRASNQDIPDFLYEWLKNPPPSE